jgi:hypothetical protein
MSLYSERVTGWCALSIISLFSPMFIYRFWSLSHSVLSLSWRDMAFQQIQPGFNKTVPDLKPAMPLCFLHGGFQGQSPVKPASCTIWGRTFMATNLKGLKLCDYFLWGFLKDRMFQKNMHTIQELKTAIQSDNKAISSEILI